MNLALIGFPIQTAQRQDWIGVHAGPGAYATGGESVTAREFSMSVLDWVVGSAFSASGTYKVAVLYPNGDAVSYTSIVLAWYSVATGLEVANGTNLSAERVRLHAKGL